MLGVTLSKQQQCNGLLKETCLPLQNKSCHRGIDGFSHTIVYLQCSGNNRSSTLEAL